jgi:hypothetical protein
MVMVLKYQRNWIGWRLADARLRFLRFGWRSATVCLLKT